MEASLCPFYTKVHMYTREGRIKPSKSLPGKNRGPSLLRASGGIEPDLGCDCQAWLGRQKWRQLPLRQPEAIDRRGVEMGEPMRHGCLEKHTPRPGGG